MRKKVGIIGAGLTGLLLAKHLQDHGFEFKIFEARDRLGGRILTLENEEKRVDRKSTRLNSSHQIISYAVFCLKKKLIHYINT